MACRLALVPRSEALQGPLVRALGMALVLVTAASVGIVLSRTLEFNGGNAATLLADLRPALLATHFGHLWRWRIPALAALWLAWWWAHRSGTAWNGWLMALALAAIVLTRSNTGHPADAGDFTLAAWADWLHMLGAAAWVGSLFGMSLVVFPRLLRRGRDGLDPAAIIFQRLSTLSGIALAVLLAGGIYNAVAQLGSVAALWTSRFGVILDVKIALVLAMIAIGAHNRYVLLPRLLNAAAPNDPYPPLGSLDATPASGADAAVRRCARAVLVESVLGIAAIGAAACLVHAMPPADMGAPMAAQALRDQGPSAGSAVAAQRASCAASCRLAAANAAAPPSASGVAAATRTRTGSCASTRLSWLSMRVAVPWMTAALCPAAVNAWLKSSMRRCRLTSATTGSRGPTTACHAPVAAHAPWMIGSSKLTGGATQSA